MPAIGTGGRLVVMPTFRDDQCRRAYEFIVEFLNQHGYSPTYPEIGTAMNNLRSKSSVHAHIHHLVQDGLIEVLGARGAIPTRKES